MASVISDAERATSESNTQTVRFDRFGEFGTPTERTTKPEFGVAARGVPEWRGAGRCEASVPTRSGTRTEP